MSGFVDSVVSEAIGKAEEELRAITPETLAKISDADLRAVRGRLVEFWQALEEGAEINREEIVNRNAFVVAELKRRSLSYDRADSLDDQTDLLTREIETLHDGVDAESVLKVLAMLPEPVVRESFVFGSLADDGDVELRFAGEERDASIEYKAWRMVSAVCGQVPHRIARVGEAEEGEVPLFDLVARPKRTPTLTSVDDPEEREHLYESLSIEGVRESLHDAVAVHNFVSISGSFIYRPEDRDPNDVDVIVRSADPIPELEEALAGPIREATGLDAQFVYDPRGPNWDHVGIMDLVLRATGARDRKRRRYTAAFHLRDTHWVPVPGSGVCPSTHPNKRRSPGGEMRCYTDGAASALRGGDEKSSEMNESDEYDGRKGPKFETLKENRVNLSDEERAKIMEAKAVWHHGPNGEATPAVWKSIVRGETWFVTNTHRAYNVTKTVEGTIRRFHRFIRSTASEDADWFEEGIKPAFGSPGGKTRLAKLIASLIPEHEKYVEPFVGGGAVFFAKQSSEKEVLNDLDGGIVASYRFLKSATDGEVEAVRGMPMRFSTDDFEKIRTSEPSDIPATFHRFVYLTRFSYGAARKSPITKDCANFGLSIESLLDRIPKMRERLKGVEIMGADFRKVLTKHDGPETFFYLDPPYPDQQGELKTELTNEAIAEAVKGLKGRFILSLPDTKDVRAAFKGLTIRPVHVPRLMDMKHEHEDREVLIANFPLRASRAAASEDLARLVEQDDEKTTAEQQEEQEQATGDLYMASQPGNEGRSFVVQEHYRGLIDPETRKTVLDELGDIRRLEGSERESALAKLFRTHKLEILTAPFDEVRRRVQRVSDNGGDVTIAMNRALSKKYPGASRFLEAWNKDRVVQRGNVHADLRMLRPGKTSLIGWTNDTPGPAVQFMKSGRIAPITRNKLLDPKAIAKGIESVLAQKKSLQPVAWLTIVTEKKPELWVKPGEVGATEMTAGFFRLVSKGDVVFGAQKTDFHEYVFFPDKGFASPSGRHGWQLVPRPGAKDPDDEIWLGNRPKDQRPYITTHDLDKEVTKAKREKIELIWNYDVLDALIRRRYLSEELREFAQDNPRPETEKYDFA